MFDLVVISDFSRREYTKRFFVSLDNVLKKENKENLNIYLIENGSEIYSSKRYKEHIINNTGVELDIIAFHSNERLGLSNVWDSFLTYAHALGKQGVFLCNDDCIVNMDPVEKIIELKEKQDKEIYLLCKPNGFSGFYLDTAIWLKYGGFLRDFPEGYYEDDFFFLSCALLSENKTYKESMKNVFYSMQDDPNQIKTLFSHNPTGIKNHKNLRKWDKQENAKIFFKYWTPSNKNNPNAIENKNSLWFAPTKKMIKRATKIKFEMRNLYRKDSNA